MRLTPSQQPATQTRFHYHVVSMLFCVTTCRALLSHRSRMSHWQELCAFRSNTRKVIHKGLHVTWSGCCVASQPAALCPVTEAGRVRSRMSHWQELCAFWSHKHQTKPQFQESTSPGQVRSPHTRIPAASTAGPG